MNRKGAEIAVRKSEKEVEAIKHKYPKGTKLELDFMDEEGMLPGLRGTVDYVDDQGQLHMNWENGRSLALVPGEDVFHVLSEKQDNKSEKKDPTDSYIEYLNSNILNRIDYGRLQESYDTEDKAYAKRILNALHRAMVHAYGTENLNSDVVEYALIPGVIQSRNTGNVCLALLELDLQSSGEHFHTGYLTKMGVLSYGNPELSKEARNFIKEMYGSYDYGYTATIPNDIHVSPETFPPAVKEIVSTFRNYEVELLNEEEMSEVEDLER